MIKKGNALIRGAFFIDAEPLRKEDEAQWLSLVKQASWLESYRAKLQSVEIAKLFKNPNGGQNN